MTSSDSVPPPDADEDSEADSDSGSDSDASEPMQQLLLEGAAVML